MDDTSPWPWPAHYVSTDEGIRLVCMCQTSRDHPEERLAAAGAEQSRRDHAGEAARDETGEQAGEKTH